MQDDTLDVRRQRAMSLVGTSPGRNLEGGDYYPTPIPATIALLDVESFVGQVWECACGAGAISKVLLERNYDVISTDLIDRGYGVAPHDFMTSDLTSDNIITNPPFSLAQPFIERALSKTTGKVAMLGKLALLEGAKRKIMFESTPLARVHVFSKRVTFSRDGLERNNNSMIAFAWFVWDHAHKGPPTINWI